MANSKKSFTGGMDADTDPRFIGEKDYLNMENCRVGLSADGKTTRIEGIAGTVEIVNSNLPSGNNTCIGSAIDEERRRLVYFLYNDAGNHRIFLYDSIAGTINVLLKDTDVVGGLEFTLNNCIDRNAKIINNILEWTTGIGDVWSINIQAALNMQAGVTTFPYYTSPVDSDLLRIIKKPPAYPPAILKSYDSTFVGNFIYNEGFKFCWRFSYIDNEESVLSPYSLLAPLNDAQFLDGISEQYNYIGITLPITQKVWQTVQKVDLVVIYSSSNVYYVIRTWDKAIAADATDISAHNTGTALAYSFYNNTIGITLGSAYAAKYFEVIPYNVKTIELARNRNFLGNGTFGYNAPKVSSLSLSINSFANQTNASGIANGLATALLYTTAIKYTFTQQVSTPNLSYTAFYTLTADCYYVDNSFIAYGLKQGYYVLRTVPSFAWNYDPSGTPIVMVTGYNYNNLIYTGSNNISDVGSFYLKLLDTSDWLVRSGTTPTITHTTYSCGINNIPDLVKNKSLCNDSIYTYGVTFYDKYQRKGGISPNVSINTPFYDARAESSIDMLNINALWTLVNGSVTINEIPDWAYYYSINKSVNKSKSFYIQGYTRNAVFYKSNSDGTYTFRTGTNATTDNIQYTDSNDGVAIDISELPKFGLGYTFTEGDCITLINIYYTGTGILEDQTLNETFVIKGISGNYLLIDKNGINTLGAIVSGTLTMRAIIGFEIYTTYKASTNEPIYEVGLIYPVINPTQSGRQYSTITGFINGDSYLINRVINVPFEPANIARQFHAWSQQFKAMSPNDKYWQKWYTDAGRANYKDPIGQKALPNRIAFSNTYLAGTLINGLSSFDPLDVADTYIEDGAIQKLQLANKQKQEDGSVLLVICKGGTISIYLGETQLVSQTGNAFLGQSNGVIGTMNDLKGSFGTENPESVFTYLGEVYWPDNYNGVMVQYSTNGLFPISSYKMSSFFYKALKSYLNSGKRIVMAFDPLNKEVLVVMPSISGLGSNLPSYSDTIQSYQTTVQNRFNPYNGNNKTLAFRPAENKWSSAYEFAPEWMEYVDTTLYGFKNGRLWEHNADTSNPNKFYGNSPVAQRVMFAVNNSPSEIKDVMTIAVEGQQQPSCAMIYATYPNEQITDLVSSDFINKEGIWYASVLRDRLSPNVTSSNPDVKLLDGDPIKTVTPFIWVEFQQFNNPLSVNFVDVGYTDSRGHNKIMNK